MYCKFCKINYLIDYSNHINNNKNHTDNLNKFYDEIVKYQYPKKSDALYSVSHTLLLRNANNSESVGAFLFLFNIDGILNGSLCTSTLTLIIVGMYTIIF